MENKYAWHVLLRKFVDNEINAEERVELYRQMDENCFKKEQFDQVTDPNYFRNIWLDCLNYLKKEKEDLERFKRKLDNHIEARKGC